MVYTLKLPTDPKPGPGNVPRPGQSFNFQLRPAFWFGMAMCDTQSYPLQVSTCVPDSDANIFDNPDPNASDFIGKHPGTAFTEMQFYPPGWVSWPDGDSCDATKWCAALNIDSLSQDPINGTQQNATCAAQAGLEYVNFAFITKDGHSQAPASPVNSTAATFTPDRNRDLFMNSGDTLIVSLHDTAHGLRIDILDLTTHQSGSMTASAANGFGQVQFDPTGTSCNNIPYDFHPMYSTSSEHTRVPWAAHSYNIAFSDEIGHFQACNGPGVITPNGHCPAGNTEFGGEPTDANDVNCYPASSSTRIQINGCFEFNGDTGFDSYSYQKVWPDGNTKLHPTSVQFLSPLTGGHNYERAALETNLPRIEVPGIGDRGGTCDRTTGANCFLIPINDENVPANFYPFFSIHKDHFGPCIWLLGNDIPGLTTNDFGKNNGYGPLLFLNYLVFGGGGATLSRTNDFRQVFRSNPCKVGF
jgi:hypothetical protein